MLGACAQSPEDIPPIYMSQLPFDGWTCKQLEVESHRLQNELAVAYARQEQTATGDTIGIVLVGLPLASMSGRDGAPEVGRLKGEHSAIYRAAVAKDCPEAKAAPAR